MRHSNSRTRGCRGGHVSREIEEGLEIDGVRTWFSAEPPGWQVSFLNPPSERWDIDVAKAIRDRMDEVSGQPGEFLRG